MTRRSLAWRGVGVGLFAIATALGIGARGDIVLGLPAFGLALVGIVLVVQGRRVPAALRVERSRHRTLAHSIRDRRRTDGPS
ncbi:hypothetical protein [Sphingomonas bacterium]|uniref:hypothetical protein n=1 Tax=Sphingomonas bacterium TaxID=1895847 RepID=UPI001575AD94|nr:hypothetical protein [Sphingomonas bacterium]